jgi:hypothetical protein
MPGKKLVRQLVALEPVAGATRDNNIAGIVQSAPRQWNDVIERGSTLVKMRCAVHTALSAITQRNFAHRSFHGACEAPLGRLCKRHTGARAHGLFT